MTSATEGQLREWGSRLFYGMPRKPKPDVDGARVPRIAASYVVAKVLTAGEVRTRLRPVIDARARQVMVKITNTRPGRLRGSAWKPPGMKAIRAHFRYISRLGKPEAGGRGHSYDLEDENGNKISGPAALRDLGDDWQYAGSYIPDEGSRREAFNIILAMPAGTSERHVLAAARRFAQEEFAGHKYVFVLHTDTPHPHVHLAVRTERWDGVRLNPRKADLQRWRERFASRLQDLGVHAAATRAWTRGVERAPAKLWHIHMARKDRAQRIKYPRPAYRSAASVARSKKNAIELWQNLHAALRDSSEPQDSRLASEVSGYMKRTFDSPQEHRIEAQQAVLQRTPHIARDKSRGRDYLDR